MISGQTQTAKNSESAQVRCTPATRICRDLWWNRSPGDSRLAVERMFEQNVHPGCGVLSAGWVPTGSRPRTRRNSLHRKQAASTVGATNHSTYPAIRKRGILRLAEAPSILRGCFGYEELLLQLLRRVKFADSTDACFSTLRILHQASGSLLWCKQRLLSTLPPSYLNFATWVNESHGIGQRKPIVSLNWDLLAERALSEMRVPWTYGLQSPVPFLKPHGSINWINYLKHGLQSTCWQQIPHTMFSWRPELPLKTPMPILSTRTCG